MFKGSLRPKLQIGDPGKFYFFSKINTDRGAKRILTKLMVINTSVEPRRALVVYNVKLRSKQTNKEYKDPLNETS